MLKQILYRTTDTGAELSKMAIAEALIYLTLWNIALMVFSVNEK
jgi:hypothetical protein